MSAHSETTVKRDSVATDTAHESDVTPTSAGGAAVTTRSGRPVKMTEKALGNYLTAKYSEMKASCIQWAGQHDALEHLITSHADVTSLRRERYNLTQLMSAIRHIYSDIGVVSQTTADATHNIEDAERRTAEITTRVEERVMLARTQPSITGLSQMSNMAKSTVTTSSKRDNMRRQELARAKELEVKLRFMEQEEAIQEQKQKLERQQRKLETERAIQEARARADAYDDDDQSLFSDDIARSTRDRVSDYVINQNPRYDVTDTVQQQTDMQAALQNHTAPPAIMTQQFPVTTSNMFGAHAHAPAQTGITIQARQPYAPVYSTVQAQASATTATLNQAGMYTTAQQQNVAPTNVHNAPMATTAPTYAGFNPYAPTFIPTSGYHNANAQPTIQAPGNNISELAQVFQQQLFMSRLPPPEPSVFAGDPIHFPGWLTSFELLIENKQITSAERLHYLKRYLSGQAKECIEGFVLLSNDDAYDDAKKLLKERFGNKFMIANAFRKKLQDWPKISGYDGNGLLKLSDFLLQCEAAMKTNSYLRVLNDCQDNQAILKKLPDWLINRWSRVVSDWSDRQGDFPPFKEFCKFVAKEAKIANNPVTALQNVKSKTTRVQEDDKPKKHVSATETAPSARKAVNFTKPKTNNQPKQEVNRQSSMNETDQRKKKPCHLCSGDHHLNFCRDFLKKKLDEKTQYIMQERLCFGCLRPNHLSKDCKLKMTCKSCGKPHPSSLHNDNWRPKDSQNEASPEATRTAGVKDTVVTVNQVDSSGTKFDSTSMIVPVYVASTDSPQREQLVYAMLDTQSDACFITESTCERLQVNGTPTKLILTTMSNEKELVEVKKINNLTVRGYYSEDKIPLPTLFTRKKIPGNPKSIPTLDTAKKWPHLQAITDKLPPQLDIPLGILIGYNCSAALIPREVIASPTNRTHPYAQRTDLGWSIVGMTTTEASQDTNTCHRIATVEPQGRATIVCKSKTKEVFKPMDFAMMSEMDFEDYPEERKQSYEDFKFIKRLSSGIHEESGHYEMPLPFKQEHTRLPDNKSMALKRLSQLKRRLDKDETYRKDYEKFMDGIIDKGFCEMVPADHKPKPGTKWYIPHHGVYHPKKPGKIRVVFDCSARFNDICINDTLLQGPDMINDLLGVLYRFRKEPVAISCDIEKMFYQFGVNLEDRDYLTFLWWTDGKYDEEPTEYRMTVHLFGAVSSPGCANFGMNQAADDGEETFGKPAADFVRHNFYVDDGLTSVATVEEGKDLVTQTVQLCASKGLRLHKFVSNSAEVLQCLPPEERSVDVKTLQLHDEPIVERTLGLEWCIQSDCFQFKIVLKDRPSTRRGILSTVYSLYDPLGLLAPVILVGRQILQDICKGKYDWDSTLPDDIIERWEKWRHSLFDLQLLQIDRCYKPKDFGNLASVQLHHFSDASTEGYGQCSYLRLKDNTGKIHCSLVMAKSRVAPLKQVTIPRLELTAAVLSVKISALLSKQLKYEDIQETFWCDSQVTLGYINNEAKRFHVFVANRVQRIRNKTEPEQWRHVKGQDNPADYASRGLTVQNLLHNSFWFTGPAFLWEAEIEHDDRADVQPSVIPDDPELRKQVLATGANSLADTFDLKRFEYFSDWTRLKRAVALCLKYKAILKARINGEQSKPKASEITVEDIRTAETTIIKLVQKQAFDEEREVFASSQDDKVTQRKLKRSHPLYSLDPFIDKKGILRIGGRINAASITSDVKHPAVLPRVSHVSYLIAKHCHERVSHQGRGMTMNQLRMSGYWFIGCRILVSSIINKCVKCQRLRGTVQDQKMSDLPKDRANPSPPFTYCAVDYFGPFYIKERRSELKRYGVLFTCMASRAIHLETANSMDTDSFINALRRFIAIRGPIRQLRSDMGTNFVGAKRELQSELKSLNEEEVKQYLMHHNCDYFEFKMNVPSASHMGGVWERQIRTVRNVLSSLLQTASQQLDDESLRTLMLEAMAIVNSRPLTVNNSSDAASPEPLTPNHLLHMKTEVVLPPPGEFQKEDMYVRKRWRRVQHLLNEFWKRWQAEYLQTLQSRPKWCDEKIDLAKGDVVLVKDSNLPRCKWLLARVEVTLPSDDGRVRKVKLRIATQHLDKSGKRLEQPSFLDRPIQKLVLLHKDRRAIPPENQLT